ncbi:MAG: DUF4124 domain-containing protein [Bdellovibrionales bacterium]|nr:DUF4124 domain-containing protein [Bdellovibrionales bacterium]
MSSWMRRPSFLADSSQALRTFFYCSGIVFALGSSLPLAHGDNAFSWVDKNGRTVYGSTPPKAAAGVKKLNTKPLSRYSSDKVLKRLGWDEREKEAAAERSSSPSDAGAGLPIDAAPAKLEPGEPNLTFGQAGEILGCRVTVTNPGAIPAAEISIAFEFPDGTLVPAVGPSTIAANSAADYVIPDELVPFFVKVKGENPLDPAQQRPKVIVHGAAG